MKREIEKKYLLDNIQTRDKLVDKLSEMYPGLVHKETKKIISYFYERNTTSQQVLVAAAKILTPDALAELTILLNNSTELVVKCRSIGDINYFTVKGVPAGEDPVHAVNRLEFEVPLDRALNEIDQVIQDAGIKIASKWSSVRNFYELDGTMKADIEFVAGYGYKAELEILIDDGESIDSATASLDDAAQSLGLTEASGALLARMYDYYNRHWEEYFNTNEVFDAKTWQSLKKFPES